ncbi:MAG: YHYH protein [Bacteroidota bacterium]
MPRLSFFLLFLLSSGSLLAFRIVHCVMQESPWYADTDGDGLGDATTVMLSHAPPVGFVANAHDADDTDGSGNCDHIKDSFTLNLDPSSCTEPTPQNNEFQMIVDRENEWRIIYSNSIPNHPTGSFPNANNPNRIRPQRRTYRFPLNPQTHTHQTSLVAEGHPTHTFGVLLNGVELDPIAAEWFGQREVHQRHNAVWNKSALSAHIDLGEDCNNAHVQPSGKYHYHGVPTGYLKQLAVDGTRMVKIGYAGDGFPIYYKYIYAADGQGIVPAGSSYRLKWAIRGGDGRTAPDGCPDGTYVQDYEYRAEWGPLDECNGMWGKTPEQPREYFYVVTDNWPSSPMCFSGQPSRDFALPPRGHHPRPHRRIR